MSSNIRAPANPPQVIIFKDKASLRELTSDTVPGQEAAAQGKPCLWPCRGFGALQGAGAWRGRCQVTVLQDVLLAPEQTFQAMRMETVRLGSGFEPGAGPWGLVLLCMWLTSGGCRNVC